jgi:mono/diheme cytochrome c family protein
MLKISFGALIIGGVVALGFAGFRGQKGGLTHIEWFSDMAHQPKFQPQHRSTLFDDGSAARKPVAGTVPIGFTLEGRYFQSEGNNLVDGTGGFANQPDYFNTGRMGDVYGDGIPEVLAARGEALLARGQERFNISCAICHGKAGKGDGVVKSFGLMTVADLSGDIFQKQPDGQIFNTITHGKNTMGAYGPVISVEDRWAIVAYVRALQKVAGGSLNAAAEIKK